MASDIIFNTQRAKNLTKLRAEMGRKNMQHHEREFEKLFKEIAPAFNMLYIKIPDVLPIDRNGKVIKSGQIHISRKRFADGVLITVNGNYIIEFKYQYGELKPHQGKAEKDINEINNSYYIVRKRILKKGLVYSIEQGENVFKTDSMENLFKFFSDPREHISQSLMLDQLIPEKKKRKLNKTRY